MATILVLIAAATNSSSTGLIVTELHSIAATEESKHGYISCQAELDSAAQQPLDGRIETLHMLKQAPRILDGCHGNNVDLRFT